MTSNNSSDSGFEVFQIESARDVVFYSFIAQRSLTPLDLNAGEYMLMKRSIFTKEGFRKTWQPNRRILYTLHLDWPREMETSCRISVPYEAGRYRGFSPGVTCVSEWVYYRDLPHFIVHNIQLANNSAEKLRQYLNVMKLLKLDKNRILSHFIFDSIINILYPDCLDSNLVVEFAMTFSFYSWIFYQECPDIVGYVLEHARRIRYNTWASHEWTLDPINTCIRFRTNGNIGKLLEYGIDLCFESFIYMEILEVMGARRSITERRAFLSLQMFYVFTYNCKAGPDLRLIWRSIPDPYLSGNEIDFAFGSVVPPPYLYGLIEYYKIFIVEEHFQIENAVSRSLLHLCRVSVRNNLRSNFQLPHGIGQLGVGHILENYLKLEC